MHVLGKNTRVRTWYLLPFGGLQIAHLGIEVL